MGLWGVNTSSKARRLTDFHRCAQGRITCGTHALDGSIIGPRRTRFALDRTHDETPSDEARVGHARKERGYVYIREAFYVSIYLSIHRCLYRYNVMIRSKDRWIYRDRSRCMYEEEHEGKHKIFDIRAWKKKLYGLDRSRPISSMEENQWYRLWSEEALGSTPTVMG